MAHVNHWGEPRSKTITWHDPAVTATAAATMSGLEMLRAVADGTLPPAPISRHFDFHPISVEEGDVVFSCEPDESAYNPIGMVHGGFVCTLLDTVTGCAVHTTLPAGTAYTSVEIKVSYLRPVHHDTGPLTAHGWVTKPGRRAAFAEGDIRDAHGKVLATASSTCLVMSPEPQRRARQAAAMFPADEAPSLNWTADAPTDHAPHVQERHVRLIAPAPVLRLS